ncbi:MAG: STAS domain-containing protein [Pseudanabaena sp. ELA607]
MSTTMTLSTTAPTIQGQQLFSLHLNIKALDAITGSDLLAKVEVWVSANRMMNDQQVPSIILNMQHIEFIDSEGLRKLSAALERMQNQGSNLLLCGIQPQVRLVLEITRMDNVFAIFPSFEACVAATIA